MDNAPNSISAGALPQTPLAKLTALPRLSSGFKGATSNGEEKGKERRVGMGQKGRKGRDRT